LVGQRASCACGHKRPIATERQEATLGNSREKSLAGCLALAVIIGGCGTGQTGAPAAIAVDASKLRHIADTDERFQSFQIGMSHLTGGETWRTYDDAAGKDAGQPGSFEAVREARAPTNLADPRLVALTSALAPLYIRYGGTTTNSVYFQDDDRPRIGKPPKGYAAVLTRAAWKGAIEFAKRVDAGIVTGFAVSSGVQDGWGAWTPRTAGPWVRYTHDAGGRIDAAELYNEPNAPEPGRTERGLTAVEFARDFDRFRAFMKGATPRTRLAGPGFIIMGVPGPVSSLEQTSAEQYMQADPRPRVDLVSYHFYGALAERCAPPESPVGIRASDALSEAWLARPDAAFQRMRTIRDRDAPGAPIWLTETGTASCGGTRWQPTFLDSFRFVDTQARLAKQGLAVIITHALLSGSNGVIDEKTLAPNASYWSAVLWRRLMGRRVLDAGALRPGLHLYAHCQHHRPGGVTVLAINLAAQPTRITVPGPARLYALTAPDLQSRTVQLNGTALRVASDGSLPPMPAREVGAGDLDLAPRSINFVALPEAGNPSCAG